MKNFTLLTLALLLLAAPAAVFADAHLLSYGGDIEPQVGDEIEVLLFLENEHALPVPDTGYGYLTIELYSRDWKLLDGEFGLFAGTKGLLTAGSGEAAAHFKIAPDGQVRFLIRDLEGSSGRNIKVIWEYVREEPSPPRTYAGPGKSGFELTFGD